jgi:hypothetical protein
MLSDDKLASRLGRAACQSVQGKYSAEIVTEKYQSLFQSLIEPMKAKSI